MFKTPILSVHFRQLKELVERKENHEEMTPANQITNQSSGRQSLELILDREGELLFFDKFLQKSKLLMFRRCRRRNVDQ